MCVKEPHKMCKWIWFTIALLSAIIYSILLFYLFRGLSLVRLNSNGRVRFTPNHNLRFGAYPFNFNQGTKYPNPSPAAMTTPRASSFKDSAKTSKLRPPKVASISSRKQRSVLTTPDHNLRFGAYPTITQGTKEPNQSPAAMTTPRASSFKDSAKTPKLRPPKLVNISRKQRSASGPSAGVYKNMDVDVYPKVIVEYIDPANKRDPSLQSAYARELRRQELLRLLRVVSRKLQALRALRRKRKRTVLGPRQLTPTPPELPPRPVENFGPPRPTRMSAGIPQQPSNSSRQNSPTSTGLPPKTELLATLHRRFSVPAGPPQRQFSNIGLRQRFSARPSFRPRRPVDVGPIQPSAPAGIKTRPPAKLTPRQRISWPIGTPQTSQSDPSQGPSAPVEKPSSSRQQARVSSRPRMFVPGAITRRSSADFETLNIPLPTGTPKLPMTAPGIDQPESSSAPGKATETTSVQPQTDGILPGTSKTSDMPTSSTSSNFRPPKLAPPNRRRTQRNKDQQKKLSQLRRKLLRH